MERRLIYSNQKRNAAPEQFLTPEYRTDIPRTKIVYSKRSLTKTIDRIDTRGDESPLTHIRVFSLFLTRSLSSSPLRRWTGNLSFQSDAWTSISVPSKERGQSAVLKKNISAWNIELKINKKHRLHNPLPKKDESQEAVVSREWTITPFILWER